jgi:hypothetical protein
MMRWLAALALVLVPIAGRAVSPAEQAFLRFQQEDKCIAAARLAHPNRDVASQRAVDADVDACLAKHGLPPRAHIAPPEDAAHAAPAETAEKR